MKSWKQARQEYVSDHLSKKLADHNIRLSALLRIEGTFVVKFPEPLLDKNVFKNIAQPYLMKLYECLKGRNLNGAEKSVFNGLYKFSK